MRLLRFQGAAINGYLDFDIHFFSDLTFLTGINGTGKTSALYSISALLMPRLDWLASHEFESISITIEDDGEVVLLTADKLAGETSLTC
jgi:predicted ATP-binding protein involved in virulence